MYLRAMKRSIFPAVLVTVVTLAALSGGLADSRAAEGGAPPTVVELFTSQGCSSCPPAERLLTEMAGEDNVVALAFHVNYWDRLGWPDRFATQWGTDRQSAYSRSFRGFAYTPQMVIDGAIDAVGSRYAEVANAMLKSRNGAAERIPVGLDWNAEEGILTVSLPDRPAPAGTGVWLVRYLGARQTEVLRGENSGRTLREANIARSIGFLGPWPSGGGEFVARLAPPFAAGDGIAVLVQMEGPGPILGAAKVEFTN
jgi:hypothetical protein